MVELQRFVNSADWTGYTLGDLREALRDLILATLARNGEVMQVDIDRWGNGQCDSELDFLVHSFAVTGGGAIDNPAKGIEQQLVEWDGLPLRAHSKSNFHNVYLNTYFYKYISSIELPHLLLALNGTGGSPAQGIDWYITHLLYRDAVEANPGIFFTYDQIPGVGGNRIAALQQIRTDLESAIDAIGQGRFGSLIENLKDPLMLISIPRADLESVIMIFRSIFLLMTYYVGSSHRRVHDSVTALLSIDMADFRNTFFNNLPSIVDHRGGLVPQVER